MATKQNSTSILGDINPPKAIIKLALPATLALLAKAVYNIVDTAYIGMLDSDIALTAVGVTVPLLLIMVSIENIFAAGAAVLAGRHLGAKDEEGASRTVTTIIGLSIVIGVVLCVGGIAFIEPLMRVFGASDASLPLAKDYAFWMFVAALANLPAQSMNCAARAESSVKISSIAVITGALLNVVLDPVFMFDWGLGMGVEGASLATTISQFVTFFILAWFYLSGQLRHQAAPALLPPQLETHQDRHRHRHPHSCHPNLPVGGLLPHQHLRSPSAGRGQHHCRLRCGPTAGPHRLLCGHGLHARLSASGLLCFWRQRRGSVSSVGSFRPKSLFAANRAGGGGLYPAVPAADSAVQSKPGHRGLRQMAAGLPSGALSRFWTVLHDDHYLSDHRASGYGLFLSTIRQGLFYVPFILTLPKLFGVTGIYFSQPAADILTILVCMLFDRSMKRISSASMRGTPKGADEL